MKKTRLALLVISIVLLFSVPTTSADSQTPVCPSSPTVQEILNQVSQDAVTQWIRNFSGEDFVTITGTQRQIKTRVTSQIFGMNFNAMAYPYLTEQLQLFGYLQGSSMTDHYYAYPQISTYGILKD